MELFAQQDEAPRVVLSTHFDCVPPFVRSRQERGILFGRGACDAKGILAAQLAAADSIVLLGNPDGSGGEDPGDGEGGDVDNPWHRDGVDPGDDSDPGDVTD